MAISLPKIKLKIPFADKSPEDRKVMAICLCFSFVFWLLVKLSKEYTVARDISIQYDLPIGKSFVRLPPTTVTVNMSSNGWNFILPDLLRSSYKLFIAVPDGDAFTMTTSDLTDHIKRKINNKDIHIITVLFNGLQVALDKQDHKSVPVKLAHDITFADEHDFAEAIRIEPDTVNIVGPAGQLKVYKEWWTDSLVIRKLGKDYEGEVHLVSPDSGIGITPAIVKVYLQVERYTEKKIWVPITVDTTTIDSVRVFPDKVELKCVVGVSDYERLSADEFKVVANLSGAFSYEGRNRVRLKLVRQPEYIQHVSIHPRVVEFFNYQELTPED